jgi:hypothetical protein
VGIVVLPTSTRDTVRAARRGFLDALAALPNALSVIPAQAVAARVTAPALAAGMDARSAPQPITGAPHPASDLYQLVSVLACLSPA